MKIKKKILVIGPISDFGGREIMTNMLVDSLKDEYLIKVVSTISMTEKSVALKNRREKRSWSTVNKYLYNNNFILRLAAWLTKALNKREQPAYFFIGNKITKALFNFNHLYYRTIKKFISNADLVICSNEISGKWVKEIIEITEHFKKPLLVRVTGRIKFVPNFLSNINGKLNVLVHSKQNELALRAILKINTKLIDQTTVMEESLLNLQIKETTHLVYGFIGRFGPEKGINELLNVFSKNNKKLIVAGNGPLSREVDMACSKNNNIVNFGELSPKEIEGFFEKIDVLVISSFEEGGPIVGVEAMAAGKLIISTKVGAMPERLSKTENNFWFSHNMENSLQSTINRVETLSSEERLKIRHQVREQYLAHNALPVIKSKYVKLVENIMNKGVL